MPDSQNGSVLENKEYELKSLGVYSDLAELRLLFNQLKSTLSPDNSLYNNKHVYVKLKGSNIPQELTTEVRNIKDVDESQWAKSLFLTDIVSLLTGIARILNGSGKTDQLKEFKLTTEDDYLLQDWFQEQRSGGLTKQSFVALKEFIQTLDESFEAILSKKEPEEKVSEVKTENKSASSFTKTETNVTAKVNSGTADSVPTENNGSSPSNQRIDLNDVDTRTKFNSEVNWIYGFARQQLLISQLEAYGSSFETLPPDLQNDFFLLSAQLRSQIADLIASLPPAQLAELLSSVGNITARARVFNLLIQRLLTDPNSQFFIALNNFYKKYFLHLSKKPTINIEDAVKTFDLLESSVTEENETLKLVRAHIQKWKQEILLEIRKQSELKPTVEQDDKPPTPELAATIAKLPPAAIKAITTDINRSTFSKTDKDTLRSQTPRLLWGTAAELFREKDGTLSSVDQALFSQVSAQTINYILSLESSELELLRTSPSSLIRHIKNLRDKILRDQNFVYAYEKYRANHDVPQISRANRVERETEWANSQLEFELFASHNITDESTPDENGLQTIFDKLKHDLKERVFVYFDGLSESALEQLYIKPAQRTITMRQLHSYINEDLGFVDSLGKFYNELLTYYGNTKGAGIQQQLLRSLEKTVVTDGVHYRLSETTEINTQQLFSQSVLTTLNPNNQEVINQLTATGVSATLDSMILAHGLTETQKLISDINPKLLEMTFGLPKNTLKPENLGQFRELLLQFAATRNDKFAALSGSENARGIFGALDSTLGTLDYKQITKANEGQFNKQISQISTVRDVVQNNTSEVVAEAVSKIGTKEKKQTFFKYYQKSWDSVPQLGQIAIYYYFQLDGAEKYWDQYKAKTMAVTASLPLPIEFIDFENKNQKAGGKLLDALIIELRDHGKEFNPLLTSDFAEDADSVAEHYKKIEQLRSSLTLYYLQELDEIEREKIAAAQGYETAAALIRELEAQVGNNNNGNQAYLTLALTTPSIADVLGDEEYETPGDTGTQKASMFNRISQWRSGRGNEQTASRSSRLANSFQKAAKKKISKKIQQQAIGTGAKVALGAVSAGLFTIAYQLLQNKQFREAVVYGTTYLVAQTLYALSTLGGLVVGTLGGIIGATFFGGPIGGIAGTVIGANMGASLYPQQWGSWLGFNPRQPPGFDSWVSNQGVDTATQSMSATRAANVAATTQATTAAQTATTAANSSAATTAAQTASTSGVTGASSTAGITAAATPALQGAWTYLSSLSIAVSAPLLALGCVILSTVYIIMIIAGAFVVPVPVRNTESKSGVEGNKNQESAQFVDVKKVASVSQIENDTPTDITYTITIKPKGSYSILITDISDQFGGFGNGSTENLVSPLSSGSFPGEAFNSSQESSYTIKVGGGLVDALVTNTLIVSFDVYDVNGYVVGPNQNFRTSASVRVGNPKEGCWPVSGSLYQLPYGSFSHGSLDAYDITNNMGNPIYAPFAGRLCRQVDGPLYPVMDSAFYKRTGLSTYGRWEILYVMMEGKEVEFIFAHLNEAMVEGAGNCKQVQPQEIIGYVGNNGYSSGPHLHYELRANGTGLRLQDLVPPSPRGGYPREDEIVVDCHE